MTHFLKPSTDMEVHYFTCFFSPSFQVTLMNHYDTEAGLGLLLSDTPFTSPLTLELILLWDWSPVANRFVHCRATRSCSWRFCKYNVAMLPTSGSPGLQSVRREHIERSTLEMVRAGDQLSLRISKHMLPWLLMLQW